MEENLLLENTENETLTSEVQDVNFDDLNLNGVNGLSKDEGKEEYVKKEDISKAFDDPQQRLKFIKSLNPETKANLVLNMLLQTGQVRVYGHERRIYLRKLIREAKKGRLDKFFNSKTDK